MCIFCIVELILLIGIRLVYYPTFSDLFVVSPLPLDPSYLRLHGYFVGLTWISDNIYYVFALGYLNFHSGNQFLMSRNTFYIHI